MHLKYLNKWYNVEHFVERSLVWLKICFILKYGFFSTQLSVISTCFGTINLSTGSVVIERLHVTS